MLRQIYLTLDLIAEGFYDAADRFHYLKLMFLLFMNNKLEPLSEPIAVFGNDEEELNAHQIAQMAN